MPRQSAMARLAMVYIYWSLEPSTRACISGSLYTSILTSFRCGNQLIYSPSADYQYQPEPFSLARMLAICPLFISRIKKGRALQLRHDRSQLSKSHLRIFAILTHSHNNLIKSLIDRVFPIWESLKTSLSILKEKPTLIATKRGFLDSNNIFLLWHSFDIYLERRKLFSGKNVDKAKCYRPFEQTSNQRLAMQ